MNHRFDSHLLEDDQGRNHGRYPGAGPGAIGDIDGVDAGFMATADLGKHVAEVAGPGGKNLHGRHLPAGKHLCRQSRFLRCGDDVLLCRSGPAGDDFNVPPNTAETADGAGRSGDMLRSGAAAAADPADAQFDELLGVFGKIFGIGQIKGPAANGPRHSGIGHHNHRFAHHGQDLQQGFVHSRRAGAAVQADGIHMGIGFKSGGQLFRRRSGSRFAFFVDGKGGQDRHPLLPGNPGGQLQFLQIRKGFQNQKIDAFPGQGFHLLPEGGFDFRNLAPGDHLAALGTGPDGTGHIQVRSGRLAGQLNGRPIDLGHLFGQPVGTQLDPVGAEGIGFQHLRPGFRILFMDFPDQSGARQAQFVVAGLNENTLVINHRSHRPIKNQRGLDQPGKNILQSTHRVTSKIARLPFRIHAPYRSTDFLPDTAAKERSLLLPPEFPLFIAFFPRPVK
ncbi:MAG: hypothetical protein A4E70_02647 [Syntrophus sp. PtaU1.Bin005]|nr:MAG: hypothetical protein A4E70_02647 [Syntrophus sp. PtaU1.Bin005]